MTLGRRLVASGVVAAIATAPLITGAAAAGAAELSTTAYPGAATSERSTGQKYPGDPEREADLVATESARLDDVRAAVGLLSKSARAAAQPFEVPSAASSTVATSSTLVLLPRAQQYTIDDLAAAAPMEVSRRSDGSWLISKNIVVMAGAMLKFATGEAEQPRPLTVHLASGKSKFASIVALGGSLQISGTSAARVTIDSWDPSTTGVDADTTDGRAYVRVAAGAATFSYANFDHLGFWSGQTGGLALSGKQKHPGATPAPADAAPLYAIDHVSSTNNVYGLFVSQVSGVTVTRSAVSGNLITGIALHRNVSHTSISGTSSTGNGVDGVSLSRASSGVHLDRVAVSRNGRDGILLDGSALASGPSSSGNATHGYGDNSVVDCVASGNDRAGIHIVGGTGVTVRDNRVEDNRMGIVADSAATGVLVQGNAVRRSSRNGISLIDDVRRASVRGNTIRGGEIGVYVRHSDAMVVSNAVGAATNHGIAVIAATESTTVSHNTVAGRGPSAIDTTRAPQAKVTHNDFSAWTRTKPFFVTLRSIFQPLTVMWIVFGIIVVIGALTGAVKKYRGVIRHPYADQAPLTSLTRGVVTPEELGLRGSPQQGSYALAAPEPEGTA